MIFGNGPATWQNIVVPIVVGVLIGMLAHAVRRESRAWRMARNVGDMPLAQARALVLVATTVQLVLVVVVMLGVGFGVAWTWPSSIGVVVAVGVTAVLRHLARRALAKVTAT